MDVARDIQRALSQDGAGRFAQVHVVCGEQTVALKGRVPDLKAAQEAFDIAKDYALGRPIDVTGLQVLPR